MNAKLPHLMEGWTREFEVRRVNFKAFTMFVLDEAMIEEKIVTNRAQSTEDKAPEGIQRRRGEAMGPFASGHPDASANDGRM
jgi:hypothetical protein